MPMSTPTKISTINDMDYNNVNQHSSHKQHSQTQSPNTPNNSLTLTKQTTLNTQSWGNLSTQIIYQLLFEETNRVILGIFHLSPHGRNLG